MASIHWGRDDCCCCCRDLSPCLPNNSSPDPDDNPYLHLELARARRAVLRARARLAACELSEQVSRTRFYRLKVKRVRKQLDDASNGVGQICEESVRKHL